jgi:hypothetical protein
MIPDWQAKSQWQVRNVTPEEQQPRGCWYVCWKASQDAKSVRLCLADLWIQSGFLEFSVIVSGK